MTNLIKTTLRQRISDLERWITTVEKTGILEQTKAELLDFLLRELATERGNLRRLEWQQENKTWSGNSRAQATLDTGQLWPGGEGVG